MAQHLQQTKSPLPVSSRLLNWQTRMNPIHLHNQNFDVPSLSLFSGSEQCRDIICKDLGYRGLFFFFSTVAVLSNRKHCLCQESAHREKAQDSEARGKMDCSRQCTPLAQQKFFREWKKAMGCFICPLRHTDYRNYKSQGNVVCCVGDKNAKT